MFKTGPKTFDVRSAVVSLTSTASEREGCAILRVVAVSTPHLPFAPTTS